MLENISFPLIYRLNDKNPLKNDKVTHVFKINLKILVGDARGAWGRLLVCALVSLQLLTRLFTNQCYIDSWDPIVMQKTAFFEAWLCTNFLYIF